MHALNLIFHILLLQEEDCDRKCISEIPFKSNEEDQSMPVEVQVRELMTKSDKSVDQRSVVSTLFCNKMKLFLCLIKDCAINTFFGTGAIELYFHNSITR
jgi:hypothetical protein